MSATKICSNCRHDTVRIEDEPCLSCHNASAWMPKPTIEREDKLLAFARRMAAQDEHLTHRHEAKELLKEIGE